MYRDRVVGGWIENGGFPRTWWEELVDDCVVGRVLVGDDGTMVVLFVSEMGVVWSVGLGMCGFFAVEGLGSGGGGGFDGACISNSSGIYSSFFWGARRGMEAFEDGRMFIAVDKGKSM